MKYVESGSNYSHSVGYQYDTLNNLTALVETINGTERTTSYAYDDETGLYYLQSRYYDPSLGRFLNADAFTSTGQGLLGNNMFAYCRNNPVNNYDPYGNFDININPHELQVALDDIGYGGAGVAIGIARIVKTGAKVLLSIAAVTKAIEETQKHNDERGIYYVYVLSDSESVQYVGRTKNPKARETAHGNNPFRSHLDFKIIARNLSYNQARGLEQALMLYYHTINRNDKKNNQINGISPYNDSCPIYMDAAENALGYIWNQFSNDVLNWLES